MTQDFELELVDLGVASQETEGQDYPDPEEPVNGQP